MWLMRCSSCATQNWARQKWAAPSKQGPWSDFPDRKKSIHFKIFFFLTKLSTSGKIRGHFMGWHRGCVQAQVKLTVGPPWGSWLRLNLWPLCGGLHCAQSARLSESAPGARASWGKPEMAAGQVPCWFPCSGFLLLAEQNLIFFSHHYYGLRRTALKLALRRWKGRSELTVGSWVWRMHQAHILPDLTDELCCMQAPLFSLFLLF